MRLSVRRRALSCHEAPGSLPLRCARLSLAGLSVLPRRLRAAVCVKSGDTVDGGGGGEDESGFGALHRDPGFGGGRGAGGVKPGDAADESKQQEDEEEEKCRSNDVARQRESLAAYLWAGGSGK